MHHLKKNITYICISLLICLQGCISNDGFNDSATGNFDALWSIIDERYCFFEYKNIDWNNIYSKYRPLVNDNMNDYDLFRVMADMLSELKDGHVNLTSNFDQARYWKWYEDYPDNFNADIVDRYYLKEPHYKIAGGMKYRILENESIGYIYYGSFSSTISNANIDQILYYFKECKGIILDIRNNGGGALDNVERIVSHFISNDIVSGYIQHKLSPAHNHFSDPYPVTIKAGDSNIKYFGKIAVLTNRKCYSAANDFVSTMKLLPNVKIIGDKTGGGSGLPFSSKLPNGWTVRFSSSPVSNANKENIEFGIDPDIKVDLEPITATATTDAIIDKAIEWINN